jgi:hypothetical protein
MSRRLQTRHSGKRPADPRDRRKPLTMERLEGRKLLATNVFVDFGFGFIANGGLQINDSQSSALGGPAVFGNGTTLTTLAQDMYASEGGNPNFNNDDVQAFVDYQLNELKYIFEPFDIEVRYAQSVSLAGITALLQSAPTEDVYIYVGGSRPASVTRDIGAALIDPGNANDNLAFCFTRNLNFGITNTNWEVATCIARQAGFTFGLEATEKSTEEASHDVMALWGTGPAGDPLPGTSAVQQQTDFLRDNLTRTFELGVSPGIQNSFGLLAAYVGANNRGIEFFTTGGAEDAVLIEETGAGRVNVSINDLSWNNLDIADGMMVRTTNPWPGTGTGDTDQVLLKGRAWNLSIGAKRIQASPELTFEYNRRFENKMVLQTDLFDDAVTVTEADPQVVLDGSTLVVDTGAGNDTIDWNNRLGIIRGGAGNDRFIMRGPLFDFTSPNMDGGTGIDTLDYSQATAGMRVHVWDSTPGGFTIGYHDGFGFTDPRYTGIDQVLGSAIHDIVLSKGFSTCLSFPPFPCTPPALPIDSDNIKTVVVGNTTTLTDKVLGTTLTGLDLAGAWGTSLYLLSTARDMIVDGDYIQIGSSENIAAATTATISHNVTVESGDETQLVISNMAGPGLTVHHALAGVDRTRGNFYGLIGGVLSLSTLSAVESATIHGSNNAADIFVLNSEGQSPNYLPIYRQLILMGHGGDDGFIIGSPKSDHAGDLDRVLSGLIGPGSGELVAEGGAGSDYVLFNDEAETGAAAYELTETTIRNFVSSGVGIVRDFKEIGYRDVEIVHLMANGQPNLIRIDPSPSVMFIVDGGNPGSGDSDGLALVGSLPVGATHVVRSGQGSGTWFFGNNTGDSRLVVFNGIEKVVQSARLAIGSQPGVEPLIRVMNATTRQHLFDIRPFDASFRGGVQADTADFNGDGIADIVAAPGPGHPGKIRIFNGLNGSLLNEFFAFAANDPVLARNYIGGVDVAVGNVIGDSRWEIVVSTLSAHDVRTFVQVGSSTNFSLVSSYDPFPSFAGSGTRIDTADMNRDGRHEIISVAGPGSLPEVAIHSFGNKSGGVPDPIRRFFGYVGSYRGGFTVSSGDINNDGVPEIMLGAVNSGSSTDAFSGQFRVFSGSTLPFSGQTVVSPVATVQAFARSTTRSVSMRAIDDNLDGVIDRVLAARRDGGSSREIKTWSSPYPLTLLDTAIVTSTTFNAGIELG